MEIFRRETDYALRALMELAREGDQLSTRELSDRCKITLDHIRKIVPRLARVGLLRASRGPTGGFRLMYPAEEVSLREVVDAIQGPVRINRCVVGPHGCSRYPYCSMVREMNGIQESLDDLMQKTKLSDLMREETSPEGAGI